MNSWKPVISKKHNNDSKIKIKPVQIGVSGGSTTTAVVQDDSKRKEILASIYNWDTPVTLNSVPIGHSKAETVTIDATKGSVLFINDFFRSNINSLIAGLTRCDNTFFVSIGDKVGVLTPWAKHFSNITSTPKEDKALLQNIYLILQDRSEGTIPVDMTIFLFVNNIQSFTDEMLEMMEVIVNKGSKYGVFIVATTDIIGAKSVEESIPSFSVKILCDFKTSLIVEENTTFTPYDIPVSEIELTDVTNAVVNSSYLHMKQFVLYNAIEDRMNDGLVISDAVIDVLSETDDIFAKIQHLSEEDTTELLNILTDKANRELLAALAGSINTIGELIVSLGKIIKGEKPEALGYVHVDIPKLDIDTTVDDTKVKVFTDDEIDAIFNESIKAGMWQDIAKLDDEQMKLTQEIVGISPEAPKTKEVNVSKEEAVKSVPVKKEENIEPVKAPEPKKVKVVEPEQVPEPVKKPEQNPVQEVKTSKPVKKTADEVAIEARENTILLFMETTGCSREEAEQILSE